MAHATKKLSKVICQGLSWAIFKSEFLNLLYDSGPWSWDLKIEFFEFVSNFRDMFYYQGLGSTSENQ